jgi:hypothetical protein
MSKYMNEAKSTSPKRSIVAIVINVILLLIIGWLLSNAAYRLAASFYMEHIAPFSPAVEAELFVPPTFVGLGIIPWSGFFMIYMLCNRLFNPKWAGWQKQMALMIAATVGLFVATTIVFSVVRLMIFLAALSMLGR